MSCPFIEDEEIALAPKAGFVEPKPVSCLTRIERRLIHTAQEVSEEMATAEHADFLHSVLCQVGMPRRAIKERYFERRSGNVHLRLNAGVLFNGSRWVEKPVPYGVVPRLVMIHLCSEALRTGNPSVDVGRSLHDFMKLLGRDTNSRSYRIFKDQVEALAACELALGMSGGNYSATMKANPIEEFRAWVSNDGSSPGLWQANMRLSDRFFETLKKHAVPMDSRILAGIKHSPLAIDVYTWLTYRLCQVSGSKGIRVSWEALKEQFGQEYADVKNFKREFKEALRTVLATYEKANVEVIYGGLRLYHSPPSVPKRAV